VNLENVLNIATHQSESIIQWTFLLILLLSIALIARSVFGKKNEAAASGSMIASAAGVGAQFSGLGMPENAGDLQTMLTKLLEQTSKLESVPASGQPMTSAVAADVEAQIQTMKVELATREKEIAQLKAAGPSQAGADADKLSARIKELEAKLAEYEILEDDIADLSLYKEENVRLRGELDKMKSGAPPERAPLPMEPIEAEALPGAIDDLIDQANAANAASAAAATPADIAAELMAETAAAGSTPAPAAPAPAAADLPIDMMSEFSMAVQDVPTSAPAKTIDVPDTGNPMADFESTVQLEKKLQTKEDPLKEIVMKPPPAASAPAPDPSTAEADDLFAEFSEAPKEDESTLDTNKMMQEMAALVSVEPSDKNALEDSIDFDKMASEASHNKS
jgi:hypothetical protein